MQRFRQIAPYLLLLMVSFALLAGVSGIRSDSVPEGSLGPGFWPKTVVILMGLLCCYEIMKRWFGARDRLTGLIFKLDTALPNADPAAAPATANEEEEPFKPMLFLGGLALIVLYLLGILTIGFFLSSAIFLSAFSAVGGFRHPLWNPVLGLLGSLCFFFVFMRVAYISLPLGVGVFKDFSLLLMKLMGVN
jgi:putative tricarboxylic transport membrane protein